MATMRTRVMAGVGAWITGAVAATGLSLLAVSLLGPDAATAQGEALSPAEVNQALAAMTATPSGTPAPTSADAASPAPASTTASSDRPSGSKLPDGPAPTTAGTSSPDSSDGPATPTAERRLTDPGGQVIARCQQGSAYLVSWSPAQGFQVGATQRGPAHTASVVFLGGDRPLALRVTCVNGVPTRVSGDDGPGDD